MAIVGLAVGLALLIQAFIVKPFQIPSGSMKPTLEINQRVLVNRLSYSFGDPSINDVVVFNPPAGATDGGRMCGERRSPNQACAVPTDGVSDINFIKRIVAGPGDTLSIENGIPIVNGQAAAEDFTRPCRGGNGCNLPQEIEIPADHYFMMGDNRGASDDSRFWGPVPRDQLIGQAFGTYWPPGRIGFL
ncbi:MAG: signal peptidase I [Solirubrobacterales bacterium]